MKDIFEISKEVETERRARKARFDAASNLAKEMDRINRVTEARRFFEGPGEYPTREEERIAREWNQFRDDYEEKHGRGSDPRYPGYVWVYGHRIFVGEDQ
jgi:hypothetical protein